MQYRPELDGIRAVAVLPVILFHMDMPFIPGGFVGVDVFFVLSGFLITNMLAADLAGGRMSTLNFYDRRIRRIVPGLAAMLVCCSIAAPFILFPEDLANFGLSLTAATLSASNVLFYLQSGYFSAAADRMPLLHTWSLGVEEQFYILFPLLLYGAWKWARTRIALLIGLLLVASLCLSIWGTSAMPAATFFLLPTRAWELLLGSLLALLAIAGPRSSLQQEAAALGGLALIAASILLLSRQTPFPGLAALPPCLGTALLIWSGCGNRTQPFLTQRLLSARPVVFVGLISYSLYLWHWPFIVFAKYLTFGTLSRPMRASLLALIFAVAVASWRLIETPLRRGSWPWPTLRLRLAGAGGAAVLLIAAGLAFRDGAENYSLAAELNP